MLNLISLSQKQTEDDAMKLRSNTGSFDSLSNFNCYWWLSYHPLGSLMLISFSSFNLKHV